MVLSELFNSVESSDDSGVCVHSCIPRDCDGKLGAGQF
jgi:hypothetical protein